MSRELTEKEKAAVDVVKAQEAEVLALRNFTRDASRSSLKQQSMQKPRSSRKQKISAGERRAP